MQAYTVRPVESDPPRWSLFAPDGKPIGPVLPGDEGRDKYAALCEFANEVRRVAIADMRHQIKATEAP